VSAGSKVRRPLFREFLLRGGCVVVSLVICFCISEYIARRGLSYVASRSVSELGGSLNADPEMLVEYTSRGRRFVPHADVVIHNHYISGLDVDIATNSIRLRDIERSKNPAPQAERTILLGDSIVVQDYLPTNDTLARMLERQLSKHTEHPHEVINAGLSNLGIVEEYQLLEEIIDALNPTQVVLSFYLNDSRPPWGFSGDIGHHRGWIRKRSVIIETVMRELELRKWLAAKQVDRFGWISLVESTPWRIDRDAFLKMAYAAPFDWGSAWEESSWNVVEETLQRMRTLIVSRGARFRVIMMPVRYQVESQFLEDAPQRRMAEITSKMDIAFLSLLDVERKHADEALFFDWCHPTVRGNEIITESVSEFLS
jgi:hypothetical protein